MWKWSVSLNVILFSFHESNNIQFILALPQLIVAEYNCTVYINIIIINIIVHNGRYCGYEELK